MPRRTTLTDDVLLALIDLAYASVESETDWVAFLHGLADALMVGTTGLVAHDFERGGGIAVNVRTDPEATRLYNEHWNRHDPWALSPRAAEVATIGRVIVDEMLAPYGQVLKSAYHQDFALAFGIPRVMTVQLAPRTLLSTTRRHDDPPFGSVEMRFMQALVPHVQRALRLHDTVGRLQADVASTRAGLDALPMGVVCVDADACVAYANTEGRRLLDARDGIALDRNVLRTATSASTTTLRAACAACAHPEPTATSTPTPHALSLTRPSGRAALQVLVCPNRLPETLDVSRDRVVALVFVVDPDVQPPSPDFLLQAWFSLTPAESHVAAALVAGQSPEEIGATLGYTRETVRWYSKQLLSKTGARTRSDLVRRLSSPLLSVSVPRVP